MGECKCQWCGSEKLEFTSDGQVKCLDCDFTEDLKNHGVKINIKSLLTEIKEKVIKLKAKEVK